MKMKMLNPNEIMSVIIVLVVFAVGAYAFFTTLGAVPTNAPGTSGASTSATGTIGTGSATHFSNNATGGGAAGIIFVPCSFANPSLYNVTTGISIRALTNGSWATVQAAAAANGTIMSNGTYRIHGNTREAGGTHNLAWATAIEVSYQYPDLVKYSTYYALRNTSGTGTSIFNVVGIVLLITAIMLIITVVYTYIGKK